MPAVTGGELERVLRLQIENEFPLSPGDLAWGWREISRDAARLEAMVVAARRETIEDYSGLLSAAGLYPEFTVAAFARNVLCPTPNGTQAILEIGRNYSELAVFERVCLPVSKFCRRAKRWLIPSLKMPGARPFMSSGTPPPAEVWEKLSTQTDCRRLEISGGAGASSATLGLKQSVAADVSLLRLQSQPGPAKMKFNFSRLDFSSAESRLWLTRGAALLVLLLAFPFAEALLFKPLLARKLDGLKSERQRFVSVVEPEMRFLQSLKQSQPPYLDTLYIFSKAAPPGLLLESVTINQQGNITVKATMQTAQQLMDFRSEPIGSGFFANITVEEQSPVPNQQKVGVRLTAQWKSAAARAGLKIGPPPDETGKSPGGSTAAAPPVNGKIPLS